MGERGQLVDKKRGGLLRRDSSLELFLRYGLELLLDQIVGGRVAN